MAGPEQIKETVLAFLEAGEDEWALLTANKLAHDLVKIVPAVVEYQDNLEDSLKFFREIKELDTVSKLDSQLNAVDMLRVGIVSVVQDPRLETSEIRDILNHALDLVKKAFTEFAKVESFTIEKIRDKSKVLPKTAFIKEIRAYWNHIDDFWPNEREAILGKWNEYFDKSTGLLREAVSSMKIPNSPAGTLIKVEALLRKRSAPLLAQKVAESKERIKNFFIKEQGLIPGYMGIRGTWKVERDDCPDQSLPETNTKLTERFAFCKMEDGKECPAFAGKMGSYVQCRAFTRLKEAALISDISEVDDKKFLSNIQDIAVTDPFVKMLTIEAARAKGKLYAGKVTDERLQVMLDQFPSSDRKGKYEYKVYLVANKPVFVSDGFAVSADKVLLETIGEGARMPKTAATMRIAAEPVVRIQFTMNALRDPEFREYLRKKKAEKRMHCEYDIPFKKEDDIKLLISEIREEFGYPISVFEILEDTDIILEKDFGIYDYSKFNIIRHSSALLYVPQAESRAINRTSVNLKAAEAMGNVANSLATRGHKELLHTKAARLADKLRVVSHLLVATREDLIVYADGAVGIIPEIGAHLKVKDPDSNQSVVAELVQVNRPTDGNASKATFVFRTLDTGKELQVSASLVEGCGAPGDMVGCGPGGSMPEPAMPPPPPPMVSHIMGDDGTVYIVKFVDMAPSNMDPGVSPMQPGMPPVGMMPPAMPPRLDVVAPPPPPEFPSPFGRFPGDKPPAFPALKIPPRLTLSPEDPGPLAPMGGPANQAPQPPPDVVSPPAQGGPAMEVKDQNASKSDEDDAEDYVVDEIQKHMGKPGLKFTTVPEPTAPSGALDEEVEDAIKKLRDKFKSDPRVKDVRKDLSSKGKPVLYVHTTMPKSVQSEAPTSINGFEIRVSPVHDSLIEEGSEKTATDAIVAPSPDRPDNGKNKGRVRKPGPYLNQVSEPPPSGDELVKEVRDIPKGT